MAAIPRNLEQFGHTFALHSETTQDMCLQNIKGISVKMRSLCPAQIFQNTFWILLLLLLLRWLQTSQTHIGPTLHVHVVTISLDNLASFSAPIGLDRSLKVSGFSRSENQTMNIIEKLNDLSWRLNLYMHGNVQTLLQNLDQDNIYKFALL